MHMHMREHLFDDLRKPVGKILLFVFKLNLAIILLFCTYSMVVIPLLLVTIIGIAPVLWLMAIYGGMVGLILLAWRNAKKSNEEEKRGATLSSNPFRRRVLTLDSPVRTKKRG